METSLLRNLSAELSSDVFYAEEGEVAGMAKAFPALGDAHGNFSSAAAANKLSEEGYYLSAFFLLFIGMFGMFNNLVVIIVMAKNKQLRSPLNMFLLNLALSDFGISVVGNPMSLMAALHRGWYFGYHFCIAYAFLMSFFGITSITTLTVLSFERYLMISRPWKTSELTHKGAFLIVLGIWAYAFVTTSPPLAGWGGFGIEGPGISCSIDWETRTWMNTSYIVFLFGLGLGIPLTIMAFSYTNIIVTLNQHGQAGLQAGVARAERRVAIMVVIMGSTFLMAWTPYAVLALIMAFGDPSIVTPGAAVVPAIFAKSSCIYNPIIYVGLNTQFRSAWSRLLCCHEEDSTRGHGVLITEKVSLTVFTEQVQASDSSKVKHLRPLEFLSHRSRSPHQATSDNHSRNTNASSDLQPLKILQLNPVKVQYDVQVSATDGGEVRSEIV